MKRIAKIKSQLDGYLLRLNLQTEVIGHISGYADRRKSLTQVPTPQSFSSEPFSLGCKIVFPCFLFAGCNDDDDFTFDLALPEVF